MSVFSFVFFRSIARTSKSRTIDRDHEEEGKINKDA